MRNGDKKLPLNNNRWTYTTTKTSANKKVRRARNKEIRNYVKQELKEYLNTDIEELLED